MRRSFPFTAAVLIAGIAAAFFFFKPVPPTAPRPVPEPSKKPTGLSALAAAPDWNSLTPFQNTITRGDFENLLTTVFTTGDAWRGLIEIDDSEARILTGQPEPTHIFHLKFAPTGPVSPAPRHWRTAAELPPAPSERPLEGLHIAIDAGHIGGNWAKMEERWFVLGDGKPVTEGDMTLLVAKLLQPKLEALGAKITLVRETAEPITPIRPDSLLNEAENFSPIDDSPAARLKFAERLFYRTAEIRARAQFVNETIKPDLVLCLHFNAEAWGDPTNPTLIDRTHLHLLLNGAYNNEEVTLADQRFAMLHKLLQRTHEEEALVGTTVADTFAEISQLPPYAYLPDSPNVRPVAGHPYLWARNLLANRLYDCPVIFMEPYVMNSTLDYARIQAGDYDGLQEIAGQLRPSIFREYAEALTEGLRRHYSIARNPGQ